MDIGAIQQAGLTSTEAKIYHTLLRKRGQQAGEIAKQTGIHRRNVYDAIERLIAKGLVGYYLEGKRKHFTAESPKRLLGLLGERESSINTVLPGLLAIYDTTKSENEVQIYRDKAGVRTVLEDQTTVKGGELLVYGAYGDFQKALKYFFPHFERKRIAAKVHVKLLFDEESRGKPVSREFVEIRYLPKFWGGPVSTNIYRDKVAIIIWTEQPIAIVMESSEISSSYKRYFEHLWKTAKK